MQTLSKFACCVAIPKRNPLIVYHRLALTASRAEQDQLDEDRQLQEAIRLSLMEDNESSTSFEDQLKQRSAKMKRKAEDELRADSAKRSTSESIGVDLSESRNSQFPAEAPCEFNIPLETPYWS